MKNIIYFSNITLIIVIFSDSSDFILMDTSIYLISISKLLKETGKIFKNFASLLKVTKYVPVSVRSKSSKNVLK